MNRSEAAAERRRRRERMRSPKRRKQRFLDTLAATYDVEAACAAAELDWPAMCELRAIDPDFAARWRAVMAAGYDRLEARLLRQAGAGDRAGEIDVALARELLKQRGQARRESGRGPPPTPKPDRGTVVASLMDKLAARRRAELETREGTDDGEEPAQERADHAAPLRPQGDGAAIEEDGYRGAPRIRSLVG